VDPPSFGPCGKCTKMCYCGPSPVPIPSVVDFLPPVPKVKFDYELLKVGLRWYEACNNEQRYAVWSQLTADVTTLVAAVNALKYLVESRRGPYVVAERSIIP
jgi:hypothetical protein